jgi:REP element-mobilizing transposase RayT
MRFDPRIHHRRSVRRATFDYRSAGAYFVTICTHERAIIFDDRRTKRAVELALLSVGRYCRAASVGEFVVMPNHVHAIIWIASGVGAQHTGDRHEVTPMDRHRQGKGVGAQHTGRRDAAPRADEHRSAEGVAETAGAAPLRARARTPRVEPGSLGAMVRAFKSATTKRVNAMRNTPTAPVWQRNYYEHVIRSEDELMRIRQYIHDNPAKWADDPDNPANIAKAS